VLAALQGLVDTACARSGARAGDGTARERQRLQLAEEWMRRHFEARAPAGALADYLGLSPMSLQRLFRQSAGMPPGKAFLQLKMREAATMLRRPGTSVKEVALTLGYRHPGDFTRAFTRFHGHPPSQVSDPAAVSGGDRLRHASRNPEKGRSPHGSDMSAAGAP
jgi:transcriptional regulator GlxA family with amidase domain